MTAGPAALLSLRALSLIYETKRISTRALDSVTLDVHEGEFVTIFGPSGSGKSSLLSVLGLLQPPSRGEIYFAGKRADNLGEHRRAALRRGRIGFVFQDFQLIDYLSVLENVALAAQYAGLDLERARAAAAECIERVGLAHRLHHVPPELSGGQRQRVAVARALVSQPSLLLADEPTGNLDKDSGAVVMSELAAAAERGSAVVMVTHAPELAPSSSRAIRIEAGKLSELAVSEPRSSSKLRVR